VLRDAIPNTLLLMLPALVLGMIGGVALGTWQAARRTTMAARVSDVVALTLISIPDFVIAVVVLTVFAIKLHLAPMGGMINQVFHDSMSWSGKLMDVLAHLTLPAMTLAVLVVAVVSRYHRTAVVGVLHEDYIRTARAKGSTERRVIMRHVLRNALGPVIVIGGLLLPAMFGGAVFIEKIFAWPGMGLALVDAVTGRDYAVVQAVVVIGTIMVTVAGTAADVIAAMVNPRTTIEA
jgi:peptide/nickel transport system permease protein